MSFNTKELLEQVPEYNGFMTLQELNERAFAIAKKYDFTIEKIGTSEENEPIYLITCGTGDKSIFIWGFPHPNEPIGSLTVDWLLTYFGEHKNVLDSSGYTWHFIYTADPDGTKLNEDWFKGELTIERYFRGFYRPPAFRMIDWTFPIEYNDFSWNAPMKETIALQTVIDRVKPDLMFPLHNAGFGGAYFFSTKQFSDNYFDSIITTTQKLGIPLDMGEPEEPFMKEIKKPFYYEFGFKDYYEQAKKIGKNPREVLKHGDNSASYLTSLNPNAVTVLGEVPYFFDMIIEDDSLSDKTRREVWLDFIGQGEEKSQSLKEILEEIHQTLGAPDPHYYLSQHFLETINNNKGEMRKHVETSEEYDRKATKSEVFSGILGNYFYGGGLYYGQVLRAAKKAQLPQEKLQLIEDRLVHCANKINELTNWQTIPIKKLVQLQLATIFETINEASDK